MISTNKSYANENPYLSRTYTLDLTPEGMLELGLESATPAWRDHAFAVVDRRGLRPATPLPYQAQPFASLNYSLFLATGDHAWLPVYVRESESWRRESPRSPEGAILTYSRSDPSIRALLLDSIQEYCARMARAGRITGDASFFTECASQFALFREILRDPQTGLWSQGRGWVPGQPAALSPGAWSRGHGWLLRGLTESLSLLPRDSDAFRRVQAILGELVAALLPIQQPNGKWPTLLHRPAAESPPETSGTAMIATVFARAYREKLVDDDRLRVAAQKAFAALPACVDADGIVLGTSPGPGPLQTEAPYLARAFPADDPHGTFSLLLAAAEASRLERHLESERNR